MNEEHAEQPWRRWALVVWPKERCGEYKLLTGRYETRDGAELAANAAAKMSGRTTMVVEVVGGAADDSPEPSNADKPAFDSSAWLESLAKTFERRADGAFEAGWKATVSRERLWTRAECFREAAEVVRAEMAKLSNIVLSDPPSSDL